MRQYYLINNIDLGQPRSIPLVEKYIVRTAKLHPWFLKPLGQIITTLSNLTLDSDGEIDSLKERVDRNGEPYYSIELKNYPLENGAKITYEILKKLNSKGHVYEIRIMLKDCHGDNNCRIFMTVNVGAPYFVWTYGFTKQKNQYLYANMSANKLTDVLATATHRVFSGINSGDEDSYIGKAGERHEI